jgi:hypothetical protein
MEVGQGPNCGCSAKEKKLALGQILFQYFSFPCQFSFRVMLRSYILSEGGTIDLLVGCLITRIKISCQ